MPFYGPQCYGDGFIDAHAGGGSTGQLDFSNEDNSGQIPVTQ